MDIGYINDYRALAVDLALAKFSGRSRVEIYGTGRAVGAVTVVVVPASVTSLLFPELHFGDSGDGIPIIHEAMAWVRTPAKYGGLFITVPAGLTGILRLVVGIDLNVQQQSA